MEICQTQRRDKTRGFGSYSVCFPLQCRWFNVTKKGYNPGGCARCGVCLIYSSNTFLITRFNLSWSVLQETRGRANRKSSHDSSLSVRLCLSEANWTSLLAHWFRYWLHIKDLFLRGVLFTARLKVNEFPHGAALRCWGKGRVCMCVCACVCVLELLRMC